MALHQDLLSCQKDQLRICQSTKCTSGDWSRSPKLHDAANFLKGSHQCQTDIVLRLQVAGVLCSKLLSWSETTDSTPWWPGETTDSANSHTCSRCSRYLCCIEETFLAETCKVDDNCGNHWIFFSNVLPLFSNPPPPNFYPGEKILIVCLVLVILPGTGM